jgi:uncharacterized protein
MTQVPRELRAVALSSLDLPDGQELLVHGCEDCACPVTEDRATRDRRAQSVVAVGDPRRWIRGQEIFEIRLDSEHLLLFNPSGRGGAVVVNEPGHAIFRSLLAPTTLADAQVTWPGSSDEIADILTRLSQVDVIHPVGEHPTPEFRSGEVLTAWLHVTNACNLRCPYCYVNKSADGMDESIGYAAVDAVIKSAVAHGIPAVKLKYAGGEASLSHQLMLGMHARAREQAASNGLQLYATLLSNGVKLSSALIERLKAEGIRVMISLDGLGEVHDAQRPFANGKPSFHLVERTIAQLVEHGHAPHLSITITSRNASGLADVVRFALERNVTFSLNFFRDNDCAASFPDLQYEEQAMISALIGAFGVIEQNLPRWSVLGAILDRGQLLQPRLRSCDAGQDYVVIDQRGRVAKCHMEIEKTLGDIFSADPLQLIRKDEATMQNLPVVEKEGCRDCTWRYWCSGGCAVATFRATGRYDIKSPNCNIYKAIYPEALRLEGLRLLKYVQRPSDRDGQVEDAADCPLPAGA